jgi:5'-3' exonuclease
MGIKNLSSLIDSKAAKCVTKVWEKFDLKDQLSKKAQPAWIQMGIYTDKKFAIDIAPFMYKFSYYRNPDDHSDFLKRFLELNDMVTQKGKNTAYWVFDGKSYNEMKAREHQKRAEQKIQNKHRIEEKVQRLENLKQVFVGEKIEEMEKLLEQQKEKKRKIKVEGESESSPKRQRIETTNDVESTDPTVLDASIQMIQKQIEFAKKEKQAFLALDPFSQMDKLIEIREKSEQTKRQDITVLPLHYQNLQDLFDKHSIPYIFAVGEAEYCCAWLARQKLVDIVITDDWDAVAAGAPIVLRHVQSTKKELEEVHYDTLLTALDVTPEQFTDICILAGSDFCPTIPKIGIHTGYKHIKKYKSMESFLQSPDGLKIASDVEFMKTFCYEKARPLLQVQADTPNQVAEIKNGTLEIGIH